MIIIFINFLLFMLADHYWNIYQTPLTTILSAVVIICFDVTATLIYQKIKGEY